MATQCTDLEILDSSTHQSAHDTPREQIHPKNEDIDQQQHTKQCDSGQSTLQNIPPDKVQRRRRPRKQARPQKCTSGTIPHKWDKTENQTPITIRTCWSNNQMESTTSSVNNNCSKFTGNIYVVATKTHSISFQIMRPNYIQWQPMQLKIILKAPYQYKKTIPLPLLDQLTHTPTDAGDYVKYVTIPGLHILTKSDIHFYFRPAPDFQNILIEGAIYFRSVVKPRLTKAACCQPLLFPEGTYVDTLYPVLLTKYD